MLTGFTSWLRDSIGRRKAGPGPLLPPGVDDIRLVSSPCADDLARLTGSLAALDQAIAAMQRLIDIRNKRIADPLMEIALLQFSLIQLVGCFQTKRGVRRTPGRPVFKDADDRFFQHVSVLAEQLTGVQARLTGQAEVVVLLRRAEDRVALLGLTTRSRRPDRLTALELSSILGLMERGRELYAASVRDARNRVLSEIEALEPQALLLLEPAES